MRSPALAIALVAFVLGIDLDLLAGNRARPIAVGAAFGIGAHLVRDVCTGPGVAISWPLSSTAVSLSSPTFIAGLVLTATVVVLAACRSRPPSNRPAERRETPLLSRLSAGLLAMTVSAALATAPARADAAVHMAFGAYIPKADQHPALLGSFAHRVGRAPVIVSSYKRWRFRPFVPTELRAVWRRRAVPMVTWEPWTLAGRGFPLRAIADGRYDRYARRAANRAAAWGHPILLRFAHEMNGTWYPWGRGRNGNTPRVYKAAWRRLVRIFRSAGADNVEWMWTPNVDGGGQYPFRRFYPGNKWVDWVGLDGFNWARRGEWQSFTDIFGSSYDSLSRITSRPVIISETGSSQSGGDKAAWVASALRREISRFSRIRAVVWFSDTVSGVDFRVDSSAAALQSYRAGIASPRYGLTRRGLLSTPANPRQSDAAPSAPSGGFGQPSLLYRVTHKLHGRYLWIAIALFAALLSLTAIAIALVSKRRRARKTSGRRPPGSRPPGPAGERQPGE